MTESEPLRRTPAQERARRTFEDILKAASDVLSEGYDSLNTNLVARRAGISIGSLYQYFPNKDTLVKTMIKRRTEQDVAYLDKVFAESRGQRPAARVRSFAKTMVRLFARQRPVLRLLLSYIPAALAIESRKEFERRLFDELVEIEVTLPSRAARLSEAERYVLINAVLGCLRAAAVEKSSIIETPAFEDALIRLISLYLGVDAR